MSLEEENMEKSVDNASTECKKDDSLVKDFVVNEEFEKEVDPLVKENQELRDSLLRTKADFDNYMKRSDKDKIQLKDHFTIKVVERFLPLADSLEQALKNHPEDSGIKTLYEQMNSILESFSVRAIDSVGKEFDVAYHEVLMEKADDNKPRGIIINEVSKGYFIGEKILRHSKVIVSKGKEE